MADGKTAGKAPGRTPGPVTLRRTGTSARRPPPPPPRPFGMGRKRGGGAKYWGLLLVLGVVAFVAQMRWMSGAKRRGAEDMGGIALKLNEYMTGQAGAGGKKSAAAVAGTGVGGVLEVPCDPCGGTGWRMDGESGRRETCPICLGHGARLLRKLHEDDYLCLACAGLGRVDDGEGGGETCPRCGGRGLESGARSEE